MKNEWNAAWYINEADSYFFVGRIKRNGSGIAAIACIFAGSATLEPAYTLCS